jgi:hypothetical protein
MANTYGNELPDPNLCKGLEITWPGQVDVDLDMNLDPVGRMEPCKRGNHVTDENMPIERFASEMSGVDCCFDYCFIL